MTIEVTKVWVENDKLFAMEIPEAMIYKREFVGLTEVEYTALAHRIASKYSHRSDLTFTAYTFLPNTLEQFVRAIEAALKEKND